MTLEPFGVKREITTSHRPCCSPCCSGRACVFISLPSVGCLSSVLVRVPSRAPAQEPVNGVELSTFDRHGSRCRHSSPPVGREGRGASSQVSPQRSNHFSMSSIPTPPTWRLRRTRRGDRYMRNKTHNQHNLALRTTRASTQEPSPPSGATPGAHPRTELTFWSNTWRRPKRPSSSLGPRICPPDVSRVGPPASRSSSLLQVEEGCRLADTARWKPGREKMFLGGWRRS